MPEILVGTSGWVYDNWRKRFYPEDLPQQEQLSFYAGEFSTVEINASYYRLPDPESYAKWASQVPDDFVFAVKASQYLTHMIKLKDPAESWKRIITGARGLETHLGPILLQFPQSWSKNYDRLSEFFNTVKHTIAKHPKLVFEFRHESWFSPDVLRLLEQNGAAWCITDSHKFKRQDVVTASFTYYRFHGRHNVNPRYTEEQLKEEAADMRRLQKKGIDVFAYFNNDARAYAVENARTLKEFVN